MRHATIKMGKQARAGRMAKRRNGVRYVIVACENRCVGNYFFRALKIFLSSAVLKMTVILPPEGLT